MSVRKQFEYYFSKENLERIYQEHIILSKATGIDNLNHKAFLPTLVEQTTIISRKTTKGNYIFTKYKLKLVSKGRGKIPREISVPTIRDRIALRALCDFLAERFKDLIAFDLPQNKVRHVKNEIQSGVYGGFVKLDVSNFYPSIKHQELFRRLRRRIRNPEIIELIKKTLETATVSKSSAIDTSPQSGIPQGLSISNILAAIYLLNVDRNLLAYPGIAYHRYVDDIFILCDYRRANDISQELIRKFRTLGLTIHDPKRSPGKSVIGKLGEKFDYLGYEFEVSAIRPRKASIEKLRESLVSIFTGYKYSRIKSTEFLLWRLNLRITGCIFQNKSKGWVFFFSEINDESILHNLDRHVANLSDRFGVAISPKRFVRTYYEIKHSKYETTYFPNFDKFTTHQKKEVLVKYFNKNISSLTDEKIDYEFRKRIDKQSKDLLTDVQDFGY